MGQRMLSYDWAGHPLGEPTDWSAATRAAVAVALASRFPMVLWLGERLHLVYNDAYIPMLGDKHPAALGAAGAEVWWDIWDVVGPLMDSVVASGVATWSDDLMLMLVNDGRRQERYFTFTYSPIIEERGQREGVFCAVAETTERVVGERRLEALNDLAAALIDIQAPSDALAATVRVCAEHDADLPFAAVYLAGEPAGPIGLHDATPGAGGLLPASLSGLTSQGVVQEDGSSLVSGLLQRLPALANRFGERCPEQALVLPLSEVAEDQPAGALVLGLNRYRPFDALYRGFCHLLADQVSAALASARAYEDERRRAESLAELDRAKTAFLANVSHEFRTPLTLMLGPLEDAIAGVPGGSELAGRLEMIQRNGHRMLRLVNSLLDFTRLEAGQSRAELAPADLGALTAGIASSFTDVCRLGGIKLVLDCQPAWADVDSARWETIVLNLVSNAFKYTFSGTISVQTGPGSDGKVQLTVRDTGTGIAADQLPRLFDRFYRVASTPGRSAEGSGIGLALVRSLVEMHGGTIDVESALGSGTTVRVQLPASQTRPPAGPAASQEHPEDGTPGNAFVEEALQWLGAATSEGSADDSPRSGRPLVLVADDNADMRGHLARILRAHWDVETAADGRQALDLARRCHPDLLVTDVMMPALDGFGLVAAIRDDPDLAALPVIILSARAGVEAAGEGLAAGADSYLVKPFTSADLVNQVAARLEAAERARFRLPHEELLRRRSLAVAELGTALGAAQSAAQALDALLMSPLCSLDATAVSLGLLDEVRGMLRISYAGDMRAEVADRYHLVELDAPIPLADVARTGQRMIVPDTAGLDSRYQKIAADVAPHVRASVLEPLCAEDGSVLGAVALNWPQPRKLSPDDLDVLGRAAAMLARAVARITVAEREHQIAMSLQERLLDLSAGSTAAVVSAAYQPAGEVMRVGGDWYTMTPIDSRRVGISVGDVVGHGLPAAAVMSQLRSALGAAALAAGEPAAVLSLLDRYARNLREAAFATVAYAVIDTSAGVVDYACAGHPYPLIVTAEGTVSFLRDGRQPPLAARSIAARSSVTARSVFRPGSLLLLYTDGLIERRDESLDTGFARLAAAAADCTQLPAGAVCARVLARLADGQGYTDDVAMIAVRPAGTTPSSHVAALPASPDVLAPARARLRGWLASLPVDRQTTFNILASVGEALNNAIEHGSGLDENRTVGIEAFASEQAISVTVSDSGRWSKDSAASSRASGRGGGLRLIHGLSDRVQTARSMLGTRVTMTFHISHAGQRPGSR